MILILRLIFALLLLLSSPAWGQEDLSEDEEGGGQPQSQEQGPQPTAQQIPMFDTTKGLQDLKPTTVAVLFNQSLDRVTPGIYLPTGSVTELRNMRRIAPGVKAGYVRRSGTTKYNLPTAIAAAPVKALFEYKNSDHNLEQFYAQCNDNLYLSSGTPPDTVATFGQSVYSGIVSGASAAIGEKINDDLVLCAAGTTPWATSGGTAYPDAAYMQHNDAANDPAIAGVTNVLVDAKDYVCNDRPDLHTLFLQSDYDSATSAFYVGYHRRLEGVSLFFNGVNATAAGVSVAAYQDGVWVGRDPSSDGTASGGACFAVSGGRVTWAYDANDDPHILPGTKDHLYWYRISSGDDEIDDGITIYKVLVHPRCEEMTNLWSKQFDVALGAFKSSTTQFYDYSGHVADGTEANYADLSNLSSDRYFYLGFYYPSFGIYLQVDPDYSNTDTKCNVNIEYWGADNQAWTFITGATNDGTSAHGKALNCTGAITWDGSLINEGKRSLAGELIPLYYYRLSWSNDLPEDIRVYGAAQIAKPGYGPDPIDKYHGCAEFNGRAIFWPGKDYRHGIDYAAAGRPYVLNGPDAGSTGDIFGPGYVNAFARLSSYGIVSTRDPYRLYLLQGKVPTQFDEYLISDVVGAVAPNTLKVIQDRIAIFATTKSVHAAVLLAPDGVYMAERVVIKISQPIADYWDTGATPYIEPYYAHLSYAWVNYQRKTVHFAVPVNLQNSDYTQTTLNAELVYDYINNEWLDLYVRNAPAACGLDLTGHDDQRMAYIGDYSGFVHRTDIGSDDNDNIITHWLKTSDIAPFGINFRGMLRRIKAVFKAQTLGDLNFLVYPNDAVSGVTPLESGIMSMVSSGYGYATGNLSDDTYGETFALQLKSGVSTVEQGAEMEIYGLTLDFMPRRESK